jgi:hypothetical protein
MDYIVPDLQIKTGVRNPLIVLAHHINDLRPKHVICGGDLWDLPSLSLYDKGKKSHRAKSYLQDITAGNVALEEFWKIIKKKWPTFKDDCVWIILQGNHEFRRERALEHGPDELIELMKSVDFDYSNWSMVIPFLSVIKINGIEYSHYFQNEGSARPIGTARQLLMKRHTPCIAFHKQGFDYAEMLQGAEQTIQALIIGSCYYHDESYKNHTNCHWRGSVLIHFRNGLNGFDFSRYSLASLDKIYEKEI